MSNIRTQMMIQRGVIMVPRLMRHYRKYERHKMEFTLQFECIIELIKRKEENKSLLVEVERGEKESADDSELLGHSSCDHPSTCLKEFEEHF